jgi:hypothetical protein
LSEDKSPSFVIEWKSLGHQPTGGKEFAQIIKVESDGDAKISKSEKQMTLLLYLKRRLRRCG